MAHQRTPSATGGTGAPEAEADVSRLKISFLASRLAQGPNVQLSVGSEKRVFQINRELLIHKSPYFATRLDNSTITFGIDCVVNEERTQIELPNLSVSGFEVFVDWIYSGKLPEYVTEADARSTKWGKRWRVAYKVADILIVPDLQNALVDLQIETYESHNLIHHPGSLLNCAGLELKHTPYYKLAMRNMVHSFVEFPEPDKECESWTSELLKYPDILKDVIMNINQYHREPWSKVSINEACDYHQHPDGNVCASHSSRRPKFDKSPRGSNANFIPGTRSPVPTPPSARDLDQSQNKIPKSRGSR